MNAPAIVRVGEVMSREVRTVDRMATVRVAMEIMAESGVSSLVIERRDDLDELGLVAIADIAEHVIAAQRSPTRVNVYEVMSKPVITLPEEMDIKLRDPAPGAIRAFARPRRRSRPQSLRLGHAA